LRSIARRIDMSSIAPGFRSCGDEARRMHYQAVVDQIEHSAPLDPLSLILFAVVFLIAAWLTARRPVYGLAVLIVCIPFAMYRDILGTTITLPKVVLLGVLLGLTAHPGTLARLRERPAPAFLLIAGLILATTAVSVFQAAAWQPVLRETLKAAEYLAIFASAFLCYRMDPDERILRWSIAAVSGGVALVALAQEIVGAPSGMYFNDFVIPRVAGPLEGPNQLAGYLELSIAMLGALTCARATRLVSAALMLTAFADVLTFSRAGFAGAAIAILVLVIVYRRRALALIAPIATGIVLGGLVEAFWAYSAHTMRVFRITTSTGASTGSNYAGGVGTRSELWHAAIQLWRQHPLLGVGAGNFELDLPDVGLTAIRTHANSLYLQTLVEGGLPLFLATLALLTTAIISFVRGAARSPFCAGALAATIALSAHQVFDLLVFYPKVGDWWWAILGMGAAALANARTSCD
jgi:O-antigen ligase